MKTDLELQLALAKMLPEVIRADYGTEGDDLHFEWLIEPRLMRVRNAEWLNVCHLIWDKFSRKERISFSVQLRETVVNSGGHASSFKEDIDACCENASWQQRATALIAVKGEK